MTQFPKVSIGSWIQFAQPGHAEILANAGFDWLSIDLEHSVIELREAEDLIRIIETKGVTPLVRVSSNDPVQISRVMDAGSHGVIVPRVETEGDARRAVNAVFYHPKGSRGVGLARAHKYGASFDGYLEWISNNGLVIAQVESSQSVENLAEILSVDGVGGFLVGPYDLSCSLGVPGKLDHPLVLESLEKIMLVAREFPLAKRGIHKTSIDHQPVLNAIEEGFNFIAYSTDMLFLGESCRTGMRKIRESLNG
jgi:2-keto-3-deoxy-L-rhamnonate aldolase RhmA